MSNFKVGGYKQEQSSSKDKLFSSLEPKLIKFGSNKDEYIIPEYTPISNQLHLSSCVANATVDALEILMGLQDPNSVVQLSRLFVYWNARMYDKETNKDEGTYIRNAFDSLNKLGVCPESVWPYNPNKVFAQPPLEAYRQGNDNQISSYYRIPNYINFKCDNIEDAIRSNHPVVFGTGVGKDFIDYAGGNKIFGPPSLIKGYHAMIVVGVRKNPKREFYIRNSWGNDWGDNGHVWVTEDYMKDMITSDIWVPTLMKDLII